MWFFLVQTLGALAAAMGLGLLAGWLLFGGPGSATRSRSRQEEIATSAPVSAELVDGSPSTPDDISSLGSVSPLGSSDEGVAVIDGPRRVAALVEGATVGSDPAGSAAFASSADSLDTSLEASSPSAVDRSASAARLATEADEFGDGSVSPRWEVEELESELEARTADVARLKLKLRKAVEEIEKRTAQTAAAREARDEERRRSAELADQLAVAHSQLAAATSGDGARRLEASNLDELEAELERAKHRAGQLAVEVEELTRSNSHLQSTSDAERQALTVEAASLRLRTEGALDQLNEFSREIATFHSEHAQHLARSQQLMGELQAKLAVARAALTGRPPTHVASNNQGATLVLPSADARPTGSAGSASGVPAAVGGSSTGSGLLELPGMTTEIANQLSELGVSSLSDIAAWSAHDVQRMQEWLPEYPDLVVENRWVEHARSILRSERDAAARKLSGV